MIKVISTFHLNFMRRDFIKSTIFSCIFFVFFLLGIELSSRVFFTIKTKDVKFMVHGFIDNKENGGMIKVIDEQGQVLYHKCMPSNDKKNPVNKLGFRGRNLLSNGSFTKRIICLGGSTTFGLGLDYGDTYPKLLQDLLDKKVGKDKYEVINAGFPAFRVSHIISLVKREILSLKPDIIILMSVFNNLATPADREHFAFSAVEEELKKPLFFTRRLIRLLRRFSVFVMITDDIAKKGVKDYLRNINWKRGSEFIMASDTVWENYRENLNKLFSLLIADNPSIRIIVLDEAINEIDYPELMPPIAKAIKTQDEVCQLYKNVQTIKIAKAIVTAQKLGRDVWVASYFDPIHLSKQGNEIIANILSDHIINNYN